MLFPFLNRYPLSSFPFSVPLSGKNSPNLPGFLRILLDKMKKSRESCKNNSQNLPGFFENSPG
jgi:hypothetical protein